jgi:hypothetical protein
MQASPLLLMIRALTALSLCMVASALVAQQARAQLQMMQAACARIKAITKPAAISRLHELVWAESSDMPEVDRTMSLQATTLALKERRHMAAETVPEEYLALLQWLSTAQDQTRQVKLHANSCTINDQIRNLQGGSTLSCYAGLCCLSSHLLPSSLPRRAVSAS